MQPEPIGYTDKGSVVLLPSFLTCAVAKTRLIERGAYLWLAQQANHQPFTKQLDGRTITVDRGEWFGSYKRLSVALGVDKKTLMRILAGLQAVGAIEVQHLAQRRSQKRTVDGGEKGPLNDGEIPPSQSEKGTVGRPLGTIVKVLGWRDFRVSAARSVNGGKIPPQVSTTAALSRGPRLTAAQRAVNAQALATLHGGGI